MPVEPSGPEYLPLSILPPPPIIWYMAPCSACASQSFWMMNGFGQTPASGVL